MPGPTADPRTPPTRSEIEGARKEYLTLGAPFKADVFVIDHETGPMVVKDFAPRAWWRRLIGRLEIGRECRAYGYLGPMPFFPAFFGRVDGCALAVEKIQGIALAHSPDRATRRDDYLAQIRAAFASLSELGFLHLDARNYRNLLLRPDGRVVFIDLAGSFWISPGKLGHRLLRRLSALYYEANVIKWETLLHPGGDPRRGMKKPPRYLNGLYDLSKAWKRLRDNG
jgi:hypothetical protein